MSGASCLEDDLEYNPFYLALQEHFPAALQDAQKKCHIICIPHSRVLDGQIIDRAFVDTHILKPSPYFRGYYVTTDRGCSKSLQLDYNRLRTAEGFPEEKLINILADETGYNKDFKPYKILILDSTIWPPPKVLLPSPTEGPLTALPFKSTLDENVSYLKSFSEHQQALANLDKNIKLFNDNYMVLQKYLLDAAGRLQEMWNKATSDLTKSTNEGMCADGRYYQHVTVATESYIMSGVHQKVFAVILAANTRHERDLANKKSTIDQVPPEELGLAPHFCCPQTSAVKEMDRLDSLTTPIEKLVCLKNTLDAISKTVNQHLTETVQNKETPCLASDDLIPLLVRVISQSKTQCLCAHLYHIENFHWSTSSTDNLSYALVTFKAATQYITDTDFSQNVPQPTADRKQTDTKSAHSSTQPSAVNEPEGSTSGSDSKKLSRFDRQMDRITKMLDISTKELVGSSVQHPPPPRARPPAFCKSGYGSSQPASFGSSSQRPADAGLGEFLSSLKADTWHSSYGKQT